MVELYPNIYVHFLLFLDALLCIYGLGFMGWLASRTFFFFLSSLFFPFFSTAVRSSFLDSSTLKIIGKDFPQVLYADVLRACSLV